MGVGGAGQTLAIEIRDLANAPGDRAADEGFDVAGHGILLGRKLAKVPRGLRWRLVYVYGENMMATKDNSVNIKAAKASAARGYHHGDLRAAVIAAGLERLSEGDSAELGLRALAREVGVSATALYRHFPDKEALLDALADEGLRRLGARQAQAWLKAGGGRAGFRATGVAYVRFAHDEPALFRLSFTRQMPERKSGDDEGDGGEVAYNLLRAGVKDVFADPATIDTAALHAWALVHGLAMLILDRRVDWDEAMVERVVGLTFGGVD